MKRTAATAEPIDGEATRTLAEWAYHRLRADIVWGRLAPDQPLKFDELRSLYGLGVSPLREALSKLAVDRLVVAVGQRGFRVAPMSAHEAQDLLSTRLLIESAALEKAIELGSIEWESQVVAAFRRLARTPIPNAADGPQTEEWSKAHRAFHWALLSACDSAWLLNFASVLFDQAERYRLVRVRRTPAPDLTRDVMSEHDELMTAAIERDPQRAKAALVQHYSKTARSVAEALVEPPRPEDL